MLDDKKVPAGGGGRIILLLILAYGFLIRCCACFAYLNIDECPILDSITSMLRNLTLYPTHFSYPTLYSYIAIPLTVIWSLALTLVGVLDAPKQLFALTWVGSPLPYLPLRVTSLVIGTASIYLTYMVGRKLYNARVGLMSAMLFCVSYLHCVRSGLGLPDVTTAFFGSLLAYFTLRLLKDNRLFYYLIAGVFAGLLCATKYNGMLLACPVVMIWMLHFYKDRRWRCPFVKWQLSNLILFGVATLLTFLVACPGWVLGPKLFLGGLISEMGHMQTGHIGAYGGTYLGWFLCFLRTEQSFAFLAIVGMVFALARPTEDRIVLLLPIIMAYAIMGSWAYGGIHYYIYLYPNMAILGGLVLEEIATRIRGRRVLLGLFIALITLIMLPSVTRTLTYAATIVAERDSRVVARSWIQEHVKTGSTIAIDPLYTYTPWLLSATTRDELSLSTESIFFDRILRNTPSYEVRDIIECCRKTHYKWVFPAASPAEVDADYLLASSWWFDRFESPPPPTNHPNYTEHLAGRSFYRDLRNSATSAWHLVQVFDAPESPRLFFYQRVHKRHENGSRGLD